MSDYIPPDLLPDILRRLPIKSLIQCTSVSKHWYSLITSSRFVSSSYNSSSSNLLLLLRHFPKQLSRELYSLHLDHGDDGPDPLPFHLFLPSPPLPTRHKFYFRIVGSVHGLICLSDEFFGHTYTILLWNPLLRRYLNLPKPRTTFRSVGPYMFVLGFGFDSSSNDFKIVRLAYVQGPQGRDLLPPRVELFSLRSRSWSPVDSAGVHFCIVEHSWSQCFFNGAVHWLAYQKKPRVSVVDNLILIFDLTDHVFRKMRLPDELSHVLPLHLAVAVLRGSLSIIDYSNGGSCCNIWVKNNYTQRNSWTKLISVDNVEGGIGFALSLRGNGQLLVATKKGDLVSYDPQSKEVKFMGMRGSVDAFYAAPYAQTLALLDKESGAISYDRQIIHSPY